MVRGRKDNRSGDLAVRPIAEELVSLAGKKSNSSFTRVIASDSALISNQVQGKTTSASALALPLRDSVHLQSSWQVVYSVALANSCHRGLVNIGIFGGGWVRLADIMLNEKFLKEPRVHFVGGFFWGGYRSSANGNCVRGVH